MEGVDIVHDFVNGVQLIEIEDEVTIGRVREEGVEVEITRYALVGSSTPRTIRVKGNVKTVSLVNLLDFGSTHNFVDATLTSVLHIPIDESQILAVQVPMMMLLRHRDCVRMSQCSCMAKYFFFSFAIIAIGGGGGL